MRVILSSLLLLLTAATSIPAAPPAAQPEPAPVVSLTTAKGKPFKARIVKLDGNIVTLELANRTERKVELDMLSPSSREQVRNTIAERAIELIRMMRFQKIRRGRFTMGSPPEEPGRISMAMGNPVTPDPNNPNAAVKDVEPERKVDITWTFWLKATEVTWAEWQAVRRFAVKLGYSDIGRGRNGYDGDDSELHPVTEITWWDAIKWCNLKSQIEGRKPAYFTAPACKAEHILKSGEGVVHVDWESPGYRLPTEAEWEYACREGRDSSNRAFHSGRITKPDITPLDPQLDKVGWYAGNSGQNTHPVAEKEPNGFGLHDMHGNVAEWCWDWHELLAAEDPDRPKNPGDLCMAVERLYRVFRGGSWADPARCCRAACRGTLSPHPRASALVGFRPVCGSDPAETD